MLGGLCLGVALGYFPKPFHLQRQFWWRELAIAAVAVTILLSLVPPIAGTVRDLVVQSRSNEEKIVPTLVRVEEKGAVLRDARAMQVRVGVTDRTRAIVQNLPVDADVVLGLRRAGSDAVVDVVRIEAIDPLFTLPYIIMLEERARIMFYHVPMSWVAIIAYLLSMVYALRYVRTRDIQLDDVSSSAASVGTLYTVLATVTGSVWAKFNWGSFWNWDPRETSIFVLLLIYAAYFLLRSAIEDEHRRARLSAVYSVIAFITAPFLIFVIPRMFKGLHPGSLDDVNAGPLLSPSSQDINLTKQVLFSLALFSFTLVYFWLMNIRMRLVRAERERSIER